MLSLCFQMIKPAMSNTGRKKAMRSLLKIKINMGEAAAAINEARET